MTSCSSSNEKREKKNPNPSRVEDEKRRPVSKIGKVYYCVRNIAWYLTWLCRQQRRSSTDYCSYFHATFMRLLFLSAAHPHTHTPLPFSCCCSCCCCSCCRCHCRCPCAYCATMHNALGFLSAFLCLKLSATLTLCTHWERDWRERCPESIPLL